MRQITLATMAAAFALATPAQAQETVASTQPKQTVITAARYLDVATGKYVENPAIFVGEDGRITSIADARTVKWGAETKHIDMGSKTLIPGLIDMHTHLAVRANTQPNGRPSRRAVPTTSLRVRSRSSRGAMP